MIVDDLLSSPDKQFDETACGATRPSELTGYLRKGTSMTLRLLLHGEGKDHAGTKENRLCFFCTVNASHHTIPPSNHFFVLWYALTGALDGHMERTAGVSPD